MRNAKYEKTYAILVCGHVDIFWTYQGAILKMMLLACLCPFSEGDEKKQAKNIAG